MDDIAGGEPVRLHLVRASERERARESESERERERESEKRETARARAMQAANQVMSSRV